MSTLLLRGSAVLPFTPAADYTDKRGCGVTLAGNVVTLGASATVVNRGVILEGSDVDGLTMVGIFGALGGTVPAKLGGNVTAGDLLIQKNDGTWITDTGSGARVASLVALESGTADELIEAAPLTPQSLS